MTVMDGEPPGACHAGRTMAPHPLDRAFLTGIDGVTDVALVRHGQQDFADDGVVADYVDPHLSELGRRQAETVADHLAVAFPTPDRPPVAVYSSDLHRARDTGVAIADRHGLTPTEIGDLREIGTFAEAPEGARMRDLVDDVTLAAMRQRFVRERRWDVYPYGEDGRNFRRRVMTALEAIALRHAGEHVVVACHGGVINVLVAEIVRTAADMVYRPAHASVHRFRHHDGQWAIDRLNEIHHLEAAGVLSY